MGSWSAGAGVKTHAALTDVSTPHVAADIATDAIEAAEIKDGEVGSDELGAGAVTNAKLGTDLAIGGIQHIHIQFYNSIGQGTWDTACPNVNYFNVALLNNVASSNDGDNITYKVYLPAGTYKLWFIANKGTTKGILDIDIAGTEVASFDCYKASGEANHEFTQDSISIATNGLKDLKFRIDGKNASSTNYATEISGAYLERTA